MSEPVSQLAIAKVAVVRSEAQFHLVAIDRIPKGALIFDVSGRSVARPSRFSLQVGEHEHIDLPPEMSLPEAMDRHPWRFLNHACEPNTFFRGRALIALQDLAPGDELTFHYATTEYDMASPFECHCGAATCAGEIRGFVALDREERERLAPLFAEHIRLHLKSDPPPSWSLRA